MVQHATSMPGMSFPKEPRSGQRRVIEESKGRSALNAKLPTGYGKTLAACYVYSLKKTLGLATRLLIIFPTDGQLNQFINDGARDLADAGVSGPKKIVDIRHAGYRAIRDHRSDQAQVFAITIQSLIESTGHNVVIDLLGTGLWMIVVDEYHHYGVAKTWGRTVLGLTRQFLLTMSATPSRPNDDSAFGPPDVSVTYRAAVQEKVVKQLRGHGYSYRIETTSDETLQTEFWTTDQLISEAGGDSPDRVEKLFIKRKMRWSPRYVSPLVSIPIERMIRERIATGQPLQVLISAMCVSHAKVICEQVAAMYPELRVDWVGTGEFGRSSDENEAVLNRYCPRKDENGCRHPDLDVLVHVGMAGEGLDSIHVSEVVFLCNASICNRTLQIIGRGARNLPGVVCNISFDSSSEFAASGYVGGAIMDAMDFVPPKPDEDADPVDDDDDWPPAPPDDPAITIENIELLHIDSGHEGVQTMARVMEHHGARLDFAAMENNKDHPHWKNVIQSYRTMRTVEAAEHDERAVIEQWRDKVTYAVTNIASILVKLLKKRGLEIRDEKHLKKIRGEIKADINTQKKKLFGAVENDLEVLKRHYGWCTALDRSLREKKELPSWLSL